MLAGGIRELRPVIGDGVGQKGLTKALPGIATNAETASCLRDTWGQVPELPACVSFLGHCWCVDKEGEYISASLTARSPQTPLCKCTRGRPRWTRAGPGLGCRLLLPSSGGPVRRLSQTTFSQVPSLEDFADLGPPEFVLLVSQMERGS